MYKKSLVTFSQRIQRFESLRNLAHGLNWRFNVHCIVWHILYRYGTVFSIGENVAITTLLVYSSQEFLNLRRYDLPIESNSLLRLLPYKVED